MAPVDLHVHSTRSDGTLTPTELVNYALEKGLTAMALTDHDTVDGIDEAIEAAKGKPIEIIPGIEYSTEYLGKDVHIVGLFINHKAPVFINYLNKFRQSRTDRNHKLCANLQKAGIDITYEALLEMFPDAIITRAHYAKYLLDNGYVKSRNEAFDKYLGDHTPYFVHREKITPAEVIKVTLEAGGIPILAHPTLYKLGREQLDILVSTLKKEGLMGIECVYSTYTPQEERRIKELALKYKLLPSGGSDFHGDAKPGLDLAIGYGKLYVHEDILETMKKCLASPKILFTDMDGTLLNSNREISDKTYDAIIEMLSAGHKLVLASGRPLNSILDVKEKLQLPDKGVYVTAFNGALLYDCEAHKILHEERVSLKAAQNLFDTAVNYGIHIHAYDDKGNIYSISDDEELHYFQRKIIGTPVITNKLSEYFNIESDAGPYKLLTICLELLQNNPSADDTPNVSPTLSKFRDMIEVSQLSKYFTTAFSNPHYLEFYNPNAGKGNGLIKLCELLDIPLYNAYAVGDAENDISMIDAAGTGIAMQNGEENLKSKADFITTNDFNNDAVVEIIYKFITI